MARVAMGSSSSKQLREPRFFKIIRQETLQAKKLMLPLSFTRPYWSSTPNQATLALPGDVKWEMKVFKDDRARVWLQNGWEEFASFYSLSHGYLLLFKYHGDSSFSVSVFSHTASEISYPLPEPDDDDVDYEEEEETEYEDESYELPSDPRPQPMGRGESEVKKKKKKKKKGKEKTVMKQPSTLKHPSFVAIMSRSYLSLYQAYIPGEFSRKFIRESDDWVILKAGGKKWEVNLNWQGRKWRYAKFSRGWSKFAKENSLEVGDKCTFQLLKRDPVLVFNVTIGRAHMCL